MFQQAALMVLLVHFPCKLVYLAQHQAVVSVSLLAQVSLAQVLV
jgi:hypothetical protein